MPAHVLAFHAPYKCRHSGVCCTSGWDIPVEAPLYRTLHAAAEWGQLRVEGVALGGGLFDVAHDLPHGEPVVVRRRANGACIFFEPSRGNLCAIQRQMDHAHLPSACRHFPRVVVIDPRGVFITLSHVCPTAASLLFEDGPHDVVTGVPGFDEHTLWEGLDARDELPPLLAPGVLWDWDAWDRWERGAARVFALNATPEQAMGRLSAAVARIVTWRPGQGALVDNVDRAFDADGSTASWQPSPATVAELDTAVAASAAEPHGRDHASPVESVPGWTDWDAPIRRYLAARAFANWVGYYGAGVTTWYKSIQAAYAVLLVSAARAASSQPLDRAALVAAFADADTRLVHQASASELARRLDEWEERP